MTRGGAKRRVGVVGLCVLVSAFGSTQSMPDEVAAAIDQLGDFDYGARAEASRLLRRAAPEVAVPALLAAVRTHDDSYVQYRALVLLYGFGGPEVRAAFAESLHSPNDRLRTAAYDYFAHEPNPAVVAHLLRAIDSETSEFVRPALIRALAAHDSEDAIRTRLIQDVDRGEGFFRSAVIEALGDYRAEYALDPLVRIATEPGPLQDDAVLAIGKIGHRRTLPALREVQADASDTLQPLVSSTACLLDIDCDDQLGYVIQALRYSAQATEADAQPLLRAASTGLAALAVWGHADALHALFDTGISAPSPARAPIALALGTVALRAPETMRAALEERTELEPSLLLLRDAFDMLDEDLAEERFYVLLRRAYWAAGDGSSQRATAEAAIQVLEF